MKHEREGVILNSFYAVMKTMAPRARGDEKDSYIRRRVDW